MRVALLVLAMAGTAHAEVCSVDDITSRIERLTGRIVNATTFTVTAEQRGNTFVATAEIGGGTREVSAPSCDAALSLIAELFQKDIRAVNEHLVNIYDERGVKPRRKCPAFPDTSNRGNRRSLARPSPPASTRPSPSATLALAPKEIA